MTYLGDPAAPDDGDPDQDGHVNLLEYALGTLPTVPDATAPPASIGGGFLQLTVPRDPARNDVTLTVTPPPLEAWEIPQVSIPLRRPYKWTQFRGRNVKPAVVTREREWTC